MKKIVSLLCCYLLICGNRSHAQVSVSGGSGLATSYASLGNAGGLFSAINANPQTGNNLVIVITGNLAAETGAISLNEGAWASLLIKPAPATSPLITGSAPANSAVINLNGADHITIDGSNNGTGSKDMILRNTNANGSAIRFVNGATHNLFKNLVIESCNTTSGTIFFSTDAITTGGNSFNEISNCFIRDRSDVLSIPSNALYSLGSPGAPNTANKLTNSEIFNFNFNAFYLDNIGAGDGWAVSNTQFYEMPSRGAAARFLYFGGGSGHTISHNVIGGSVAGAGGVSYFKYGGLNVIEVSAGTAAVTRIDSNVLRNMGANTGYGINVGLGLVSVTGNYLGAASPASGLKFYGSSCAIKVNSASGCVISHNTINNMANDLGGFQDENYIGIQLLGTGSHLVTGNQVRNIRSSASMEHIGGGIGSMITAILSESTGMQSITDNIIDSVGMTAFGPVYGLNNTATGIQSWNSMGITVSKNKISNIYGVYNDNGTAGELITGMSVSSQGIILIANNMVSLNGGSTGKQFISGIDFSGNSASDSRLYYNTVHIYGTSVNSAASCCANRYATGSTQMKNNIFDNTRGGGGTKNAALSIINATGFTPGASDFNVFNNHNPAALLYWSGTPKTLAGFRTTTGGDMGSLNIQPVFVSDTNLHLNTSVNCGIDGKGTPVAILDDIDNEPREMLPDAGADEFTATFTLQLYSTPGTTVCDSRTVTSSGTGFNTSNCWPMARILPAGSQPVAGRVQTCSYIDPVVLPQYNAEPYVQRHYDIEPATNAATATARVTLLFTDNEFEVFNANNGVRPDLPTLAGGGNSDPNRANLRVAQYHGAALTAPSQPNQYAAGTVTGINPADEDVHWNGNYWEVSFDVNGFSGFYINTSITGVLPITVNYFRGARQNNRHLLNWKVTCNSTPKVTLVLERSNAANMLFYPIYSVEATAARCDQPFDYTDIHLLPGLNYYRVKMTDADGKVSYSSTVVLLNAAKGFEVVGIAPNPVVSETFQLNVTSATAKNIEVLITDLQGRRLQRRQISIIAGFNVISMNAGTLAAGSYLVTVITEDGRWTERFVK